MSTSSTISMQLPDGKVKTIYCHSDGYLSHNGKLLLEVYNTPELVEELLNLGDLSFLDITLKPTSELGLPRYAYRINGLVKHSFDTPQKNVTIAYMRDRGETECEARIYPSFKMAQKEGYDYLYKDGEWYYETSDTVLKLLTSQDISTD